MVKSSRTYAIGRYALTVVQGLLLVLIVYLVVRTIILFITPESVWEVNQASSANSVSLSEQAKTYSFAFDPFHRDAAPAVIEEGFDAPETTLNLKMVGRRAGEKGSAIIQTPDRKQGVYKIGDEIISGVILKAVNPDYIVLSLDGRLERLTFERSEQSALTTKSSSVPDTAVTNGSISSLLMRVNLERVEEGGRIKGFKIVPKQSGTNLSAFGLRTGDIVTRIGNQDLTTGRPNLQKLFANLSTRSSTDVKLIRNGQPLTVKVGQ